MQSLENIRPTKLSIAIDDNPTAATQTLTSDNTNVAADETVTINTTVYTFKDTLTGAANEVLIGADADASLTALRALINSGRAAAAASAVLTSDNTNVADGATVTVGSKTYTFKTALTEAPAVGTLTSDATNVSAGDTVTIDTVTYVFKTSLVHFGNEVLIGASAAATLDNLKDAINANASNYGVTYGRGITSAHPTVTATTNTDTTQVVQALINGTAGNSLATTETSSHLAWGGATLASGVASTANEVLIGADADSSLANLKAAINGAAGAGTTYAYATVASTQVTAGAIAAHALTITAQAVGTAGNAFASTETSTHLSFAGSTFSGGVAATAVNPDVTCGAVTSHAVVVTAKTAGAAANAYATTETSSHLSWGAATMAGGGSTIGTGTVGGDGGKINQLISVVPNFTGTPTHTIKITSADGDLLYTSGNINENGTTMTALAMMLSPTDIITLTTSTKVEETSPVLLYLR